MKGKKLFAALLLVMALTLAAGAELPPVETRAANSAYEAAFEGQTRAPGMKTRAEYRADILTDDLNAPWAVAALPDGRLIISEKGGSVRIHDLENGLSDPIPGIGGLAVSGQGGLLDVAPAPDFADSRLIYFTLAEQAEGGSQTALGRGRLSDDERVIENFEVLWRAGPPVRSSGHFGSRIALGTDGSLFVSTGDRQGMQTRPRAQDRGSAYGKIVRLGLDGRPYADRPPGGVEGALEEVYSLGHRNVQGLAIQPDTGQLWATEMGPRGGDELNLILPGKNYGWPVIGYGIEYSGEPVGGGLTQAPGMEQPVYYWDPVPAVSGMAFYTGGQIPEWQGDLFIGGLAGSHIIRLKLLDNRVLGEERLLEGEGQRFRDVESGPDGALYAVTDEGRLYRIGP